MYVPHNRAMGYRTRIPTLQFSMDRIGPMSYSGSAMSSSNDKDGSTSRFNVARTGRLRIANVIEIALELLDDDNLYIPNDSEVSPSQPSEV